ncbi:MAG: hypothetical protein AB7Q27_18040, partial [Acidimicrobiia bacterium]
MVAKVGAGGQVCLYTMAATHLVVDVNGWFTEPSPGTSSVIIPDTTTVLSGGDVLASAPTGTGLQTVILHPGATPPAVGEHLVVGPSTDLPDGVVGLVQSVTVNADGTISVVLAPASMDEVFESIEVDAEGTINPTLVPVVQSNDSELFSRVNSLPLAIPKSAFICSTGTSLLSPNDLWDSTGDAPLTMRFENTKFFHHFSSGGILGSPFFLFQLKGEFVASVEFRAKASFSCELSPTFRRNFRLRVPVANVMGIPVTVNLEPAIKFEVSASAGLSLSQRHYFSVSFIQDGFGLPQASSGHSADPVAFGGDARIDASLFAGGDLSLMFGGGYASANAQAGIFGAFGPRWELTLST